MGAFRTESPPASPTADQGRSIPSEPAAQLPTSELKPKCAEGHKPERPATGTKISQGIGTFGESTLEIKNGLGVDAAVRLLDSDGNITTAFVYIHSKDSYTIKNIGPGTYSLVFASGMDWIPACKEFQENENIQEFEKRLEIKDSKDYWTSFKVTLNPVLNGNARTKTIDRERFLKGELPFSISP